MTISRMQNPRQMYGLGSLVKKAFKGVKKIVKSPIGKAAILGGLGMYGMGAGPFSGMKGSGFLSGLGKNKWLGKAAGFLNPWSEGSFSGKKAFGLGAGALVAAPLIQSALKMGPYKGDEEEEEVDWTQVPTNILNLRNQARDYYTAATPDYLGSPFMPDKQFVMPNFYAAEGGRAGLLNGGGAGEAQMEQMLRAEYLKYKNKGGTMPYEQFKILVMKQAQQGQMPNQMMAAGGRIGKQEGGLMDMGGQEKDYRENGGFVPIGGEERADDVPARLSKNEFVFTADAVRAAGGGDIDAGSEVMQNVMDNLEQGGEVSEDSQGLGGGEEIMSEEIIDESNPAQGMFDNYEQLQSRVA